MNGIVLARLYLTLYDGEGTAVHREIYAFTADRPKSFYYVQEPISQRFRHVASAIDPNEKLNTISYESRFVVQDKPFRF